MGLFAEVDTLDTRRNRGQDFVGYGAESFGKSLYGSVFTEDFYRCSYMNIGTFGHIYHAQVHADIANRGAHLAIYQE